jgi:hypothetical protein
LALTPSDCQHPNVTAARKRVQDVDFLNLRDFRRFYQDGFNDYIPMVYSHGNFFRVVVF